MLDKFTSAWHFFNFLLAHSFLSAIIMVGALASGRAELPAGSACIFYIVQNENSSQFQVLFIFGPECFIKYEF